MELAAALDFAADHTRGVLMTLRRDGRPQASNIMFAVIDGTVRVSVTADRAKTANLRRDPRGSLHVTSDDFWQYVVIDGDAELSDVAAAPDDATCAELREVYRAISGEHPDWDDYDRAMVADHRLVVRLHPTHAYGQVRG
jgi:PPOX class probable F420-dependent enzyme